MSMWYDYLNIIIPVVLVILGYFFGVINERKHYRSIRQREHELRHIVISSYGKKQKVTDVEHSELLIGNVVISIDQFKRLAAYLKGILGGSLTHYETLVDRARREAVLRLQQKASDINAHKVINVRYETSSISKNDRGGVGSIEVLAYGTAIVEPSMASDVKSH